MIVLKEALVTEVYQHIIEFRFWFAEDSYISICEADMVEARLREFSEQTKRYPVNLEGS